MIAALRGLAEHVLQHVHLLVHERRADVLVAAVDQA